MKRKSNKDKDLETQGNAEESRKYEQEEEEDNG